MSDQTFLQLLIDRAALVVALQKKGRMLKAAYERSGIYSLINAHCQSDTASIAMYEKLMLYYLEEKPATTTQTVKRRNTKEQKRKVRR